MSTSMKQYYLFLKGQSSGPYSSKEIAHRISHKNLKWSDYIYDSEERKWLMLVEHQEFSLSVVPAPKKESALEFSEKKQGDLNPKRKDEWYLLKVDGNAGPYSQAEIFKMLRKQEVYEYDFIWNQKLPVWRKISEVTDFSLENQKKEGLTLVGEEGGAIPPHFRRRHARSRYGCSLIVHDNRSVYKGKSLEISVGGASVIIDHSHFENNGTLYLHFKPSEAVPPFNAICQVVSKQPLRSIVHGPSTPMKYGVKFVSLQQEAREKIHNFTEKKAG